MTTISLVFAFIFYLVAIVFIVGMARKIYQYANTPAPLKIVVSPAPLTKTGVYARMFYEVVLFASLFKSSKWTWIFGWLFHFGLFIVLIRHLRYFVPGELPEILAYTQMFKYGAIFMIIGLFGLLARRVFVDRVRYISAPSDYLMLLLLIVIGVSGAIMTFTSAHTDVAMVKEFASGIISFNVANMPVDFAFVTHLIFFFVLLAIFPVSKLLHVPGVFFSPTRNQVDNARNKRHISPWALQQEQANEVRLGETLGKDN